MGHKPWALEMAALGNDGNALPLGPLARKYIEPLVAFAVKFFLVLLCDSRQDRCHLSGCLLALTSLPSPSRGGHVHGT